MQFNDFEKMVIPFKDKLYRFSLRIVGNAFDAEDVIQEVMVKLWKKILLTDKTLRILA